MKNLPNLIKITVLTIFLATATAHAQTCAPITTVSITSPDARATTIVRNMDYYGAWKSQSDSTITFTATATGGDLATAYEWYVDGMLQTDSTRATFILVTPTVEGFYSVYAAAVNACTKSNTARSKQMTVIVTKNTKEPCLIQGDLDPIITASLTCPEKIYLDLPAATNVNCTTLITYQWEQSDDNSSWTNVPGGTDAEYVITDIIQNTTRYYRRKATCDCGSITSKTTMVTVTFSNIIRPLPDFMDYNLGADPQYDTPKKQMEYLATTYSGNELDARVYGGLYQWGRKNLPYAVSTDGSYLRYNGDGVPNHSIDLAAGTPVYDPDGQITHVGAEPTDDLHVYVLLGGAPYDWRGATPDGSTSVDCDVNFQCDSLWGNGVSINTPTDPDGILWTDGHYYQKPHKTINDPCPPGFRVPTQDDWERLGDYCNPSDAGGFIGLSKSYNTTTGLTWVSTRCSNGSCVPYIPNMTWSDSTPGGYAIYHRTDWENASSDYKDGTLSLHESGAPTPFLFLPAAGYRQCVCGNTATAGADGCYWSSSVKGIQSYYIYFNIGSIYPYLSSYRAEAYSIRCVAGDPYLSVSPTGYIFRHDESGSGDAQSFTVITNQGGWSWSAVYSDCSASDFTITQSGNTLEVYPNSPNPSLTDDRVVTITITAGSLNEVVTVNQNLDCTPAQPDAISASNTTFCAGTTGLTYSVTTPVAGITYTWSVPAGWTITAGQGSSSITVTAGTGGGTISVTPSNTCGGNGTPRTTAVTINIPAQPDAISGDAAICANTTGLTYSVTTPVAGVTYTWSFPTDWTITAGQGTSSVTATATSTAETGTITVTPSNTCGNGTARTRAVTVNTVPAQPIISGPGVVCKNTELKYSAVASGAQYYSWSIPYGWVDYTYSATSTNIFKSSTNSGTITVTPSNACGYGPPQTKTVTIKAGGCCVQKEYLEPYNYIIFMCYNLGASSVVSTMTPTQQQQHTTPANNYGDLYQWGRKTDGHEQRNSPCWPTSTPCGTWTDTEGVVTILDSDGQVPCPGDPCGYFIRNVYPPFTANWRSPSCDTLWNIGSESAPVKHPTNDPCPYGWRVPTQSEFNILANSMINQRVWYGTNASGTPGVMFRPAANYYEKPDWTLFLPAANYRDYQNGGSDNVSGSGCYWSSSGSYNDGYGRLYFTTLGSTIYTDGAISSNGHSIRCVSDE